MSICRSAPHIAAHIDPQLPSTDSLRMPVALTQPRQPPYPRLHCFTASQQPRPGCAASSASPGSDNGLIFSNNPTDSCTTLHLAGAQLCFTNALCLHLSSALHPFIHVSQVSSPCPDRHHDRATRNCLQCLPLLHHICSDHPQTSPELPRLYCLCTQCTPCTPQAQRVI